jgi:hypothetical protein
LPTSSDLVLLACLAGPLLTVPGSAVAAPEEIQVYEDDLVKPG